MLSKVAINIATNAESSARFIYLLNGLPALPNKFFNTMQIDECSDGVS